MDLLERYKSLLKTYKVDIEAAEAKLNEEVEPKKQYSVPKPKNKLNFDLELRKPSRDLTVYSKECEKLIPKLNEKLKTIEAVVRSQIS